MDVGVVAGKVDLPALAAVGGAGHAAHLDPDPDAIGIVLVDDQRTGATRLGRLDRHAPALSFGNVGKRLKLGPRRPVIVAAEQRGGLGAGVQTAVAGRSDLPHIAALELWPGPGMAPVFAGEQPPGRPREQTAVEMDQVTDVTNVERLCGTPAVDDEDASGGTRKQLTLHAVTLDRTPNGGFGLGQSSGGPLSVCSLGSSRVMVQPGPR